MVLDLLYYISGVVGIGIIYIPMFTELHFLCIW